MPDDDGSKDGAGRPQGAPLRFFGFLISGMNAAGSCWIVVLMLLINTEAISRSAFNQPIIGVIELIEISVIGIVFMQLADSLRRGVFIRSDGLFNQVMGRKPRAAHVMGVFTYALGAFFMGLILWGSVPYFIDAWTNDWYVGVEGMFTAPKWPVVLVVVIAVFVTLIQFLIMMADHLRQFSVNR
ncbi:MAG: TRAP transporter small permease subunit [Rhodospirillaceae bacterium]|nr:TRAP transporter small permease subunit [Rhodospirillaceae bacterium]